MSASRETIFDPRSYHAVGDGVTDDTDALQAAIDAAANVGGRVRVGDGRYLTGSLFLGSGVTLEITVGAVIIATTEDARYPTIFSRVAGIEMDGPAALINAIGKCDVRIEGEGTIDGNGQYWWDRYWGPDGNGGMRADYDQRGLRWAADYDTVRPRLILFHECRDVSVTGVSLRRSPFWTLHLCYCTDVYVGDVKISDSFGPSTDGIDIDSCERVLVEKCDIACGDDNVVLKSGRDADGRRIGRPCIDVEVRDCVLREGLGVALGSDLSGGIRNVRMSNLHFVGTDYGFRIKSSRARGGVVDDVVVEDITMQDVVFPFSFALNWYPWFNAIEIPEHLVDEAPPWWHVLAEPAPADLLPTTVRDLVVRRAVATLSPDYHGPSRAFDLDGYPENPMTNVRFEDVRVHARELGRVVGVQQLTLAGVQISVDQDLDPDNDLYDHRVHHQWRQHA